MSAIRPRNPDLLTDTDVDYAAFHCCGDEDLVFPRCRTCGFIWVECHECSTWYVDLADLSRRESSFTPDTSQGVCCPSCRQPFADWDYLSPEHRS